MRGHRADRTFGDAAKDSGGELNEAFQRHRASMRQAMDLFDAIFGAMEDDPFFGGFGQLGRGSGPFGDDGLGGGLMSGGSGRNHGSRNNRRVGGLLGIMDDHFDSMLGNSSGMGQMSSFSSSSIICV